MNDYEKIYLNEDDYWKKNHGTQSFAQEGSDYERYAPAYRTGMQGVHKYKDREFDAAEEDLARDYEKNVGEGGLPWDHARHAVKAAWSKLSNDVTPMDRDRGMRTGM